ncbi:MAG TPA: hypothetical protein VFW89_04125 [Gemmatimonadaceae bacterium]|nr:hypothetical protein [Gemmatimonadaceae bacterium]
MTNIATLRTTAAQKQAHANGLQSRKLELQRGIKETTDQIADAIATGADASTFRATRTSYETELRDLDAAMPLAHRHARNADQDLARVEQPDAYQAVVDAGAAVTQCAKALKGAIDAWWTARRSYTSIFMRCNFTDRDSHAQRPNTISAGSSQVVRQIVHDWANLAGEL